MPVTAPFAPDSSHSAQSAPNTTEPAGRHSPSRQGTGTSARYRSRCCRSREVSSSRARPGRHQNHWLGSNTAARSAARFVPKPEARSRVSSCQRNRSSPSGSAPDSPMPLSRSRTLSTVKGRTPKGFARSMSASLASNPSGRNARSNSTGGTRVSPSVARARAITSRLRRPATPSAGSGIGSNRRAPGVPDVGSNRLSASPRSPSISAVAAVRSSTTSASIRSSRARNPLSAESSSQTAMDPGRQSSLTISQRSGWSRGCREMMSSRARSVRPGTGSPSPTRVEKYAGENTSATWRVSPGLATNTSRGLARTRPVPSSSIGSHASSSRCAKTSSRKRRANPSSGSSQAAIRLTAVARSKAESTAASRTASATSAANSSRMARFRLAEPR